MAGIYGNILDHFPELFVNVLFWEMERLTTKGFGPRVDQRRVPVIVLNDAGDMIKRKKLIDEWVMDNSGNDVMYSYDDAQINMGSYLEHPYTKDLNIIAKKLSYSAVGGMIIWGIQRVQGEDPSDPKTLLPIGGVF